MSRYEQGSCNGECPCGERVYGHRTVCGSCLRAGRNMAWWLAHEDEQEEVMPAVICCLCDHAVNADDATECVSPYTANLAWVCLPCFAEAEKHATEAKSAANDSWENR